tara:strand:- start:290 stop:442 length:153 start_codon:yes stop_codon:yes gene_type:complete
VCAFALKGVSLFPLFVSLQNYAKTATANDDSFFFDGAKERKKKNERKKDV